MMRESNTAERLWEEKESEALGMVATDVQVKFDAPAILRKWPSLKNERVSAALGARPYLVVEGSLDECIRQFMSKPASQHTAVPAPRSRVWLSGCIAPGYRMALYPHCCTSIH